MEQRLDLLDRDRVSLLRRLLADVLRGGGVRGELGEDRLVRRQRE